MDSYLPYSHRITASEVTINPHLDALMSSSDAGIAQFAKSLCTLVTLLTLKSRNFSIVERDRWVLFETEAGRREAESNGPPWKNTKEYDDVIGNVVKEIKKNLMYEGTGEEFKRMIKGGKSATSWWNNKVCHPAIIGAAAKKMEEEFSWGPEGWKK